MRLPNPRVVPACRLILEEGLLAKSLRFSLYSKRFQLLSCLGWLRRAVFAHCTRSLDFLLHLCLVINTWLDATSIFSHSTNKTARDSMNLYRNPCDLLSMRLTDRLTDRLTPDRLLFWLCWDLCLHYEATQALIDLIH